MEILYHLLVFILQTLYNSHKCIVFNIFTAVFGGRAEFYMYKKLMCFILTIVMSLFLLSCSTPRESESLSVTGIYFDTIVQIKAWGADTETLNHCLEICRDYEKMFSNKIETSDISRINNAGGIPVTVSRETIELLEKGLYYSKLTEGAFDITIAPLTELWNFKNNPEGLLPDPEAIKEAVSHIDYSNVHIEGNQVYLNDPEAGIDLGGIAKGYVADRLKEYLSEEGISHALINLGGNILALGNDYGGQPFTIGIQKPFDEQNVPITTLDIEDCSVVSSGTYERYFEKDGVIYHHILNPDGGYPYENDLLQVTIISKESVDGDALSTCCFALGLEEGTKLIEKTDGIQAVFITKDYKLHTVGM